MSSSRKKLPETKPENLIFGLISSEILVSALTGPLLVGLLGSKNMMQWFQEIGQSSEELFRGDRLPVLKFPHPQAPEAKSRE